MSNVLFDSNSSDWQQQFVQFNWLSAVLKNTAGLIEMQLTEYLISTATVTHLCCRKLIWEFVGFFWNPLPLLQTPENLGNKKRTIIDFKSNRENDPIVSKLQTHSKETIQQPRAMPKRMLRVRLWPQDTTWVVLSQTRSTIENPPRVVTTCITIFCFLFQ